MKCEKKINSQWKEHTPTPLDVPPLSLLNTCKKMHFLQTFTPHTQKEKDLLTMDSNFVTAGFPVQNDLLLQ